MKCINRCELPVDCNSGTLKNYIARYGFSYLQQLIQYMIQSDKRGVSANGPGINRPIIGGPVFPKIEPITLCV